MSQIYSLSLPVVSWPCTHSVQSIALPISGIQVAGERIMAISSNSVYQLDDNIEQGFDFDKIKQ
jgi:hypothetical protein